MIPFFVHCKLFQRSRVYYAFQAKDTPTFENISTLSQAVQAAIANAKTTFGRDPKWKKIFHELTLEALYTQLPDKPDAKLTEFDRLLEVLPEKALRLPEKAQQATILMYQALCKERNQSEAPDFQEKCTKILADATPTLHKHRGIKGWINAVLETLAHMTEVITPGSISRRISPKVRFFKTDTKSEKLIKAFEESLKPKN